MEDVGCNSGEKQGHQDEVRPPPQPLPTKILPRAFTPLAHPLLRYC